MQLSTAEQFAQLAGHLDLVPPSILEETCRELGGADRPAADLGAALVRRELLTGYQVERLLRGEKRGFFFGSAKILYQIGAGSFARVFRAEDRDTGRVFAVKVLRARYGGDPDKTKLFRHEGELGRLLRHPNIVAIEDVGEEHGSSYITMEFVEGQTLRELVRIRGAVDLPRALDMILQMATGMEYAHRRGVTHRDMKPSNVLISSAGVAKLVDFGLAGVDQSGDQALSRMEKPRTIDYVALEKATGIRDDSFRSDIYFLGTVAYLALCGVSPLAESRDRSVRSDPRRFTTVQPLQSRAADLPREVTDLVSRMMHLDPLERWQTAGDLRRAVEQVIARRSTAAAAPDRGQAAAEERATLRGTVMIVEAAERQQPLRDFFAKLGYRVLVTENPQRALGRFATTPLPADCLVMSTATLGRQALDAFNTLSTDPFYTAVPALLVAGSRQTEVAGLAKVDRLRRVVQMPVQPSEMELLLAELLTPDAGSASAG